jgi:ATP-dependent protease Clp ATPase subunit
MGDQQRCSFCNRAVQEVDRMVQSPKNQHASICDDCIRTCVSVLEQTGFKIGTMAREGLLARLRHWFLGPERSA